MSTARSSRRTPGTLVADDDPAFVYFVIAAAQKRPAVDALLKMRFNGGLPICLTNGSTNVPEPNLVGMAFVAG
jgi:hypothetical protein